MYIYYYGCKNKTAKMVNGKTIMVCDDEIDLLELLRVALGSEFNVLTVCSGKECIEKFIYEKYNGKKIDCVLVDYKLGDMLGDIVACKIKELNGTKTILVSAYEIEPEIIHNLKEKKCIVSFIKKPFSIKEMIEKLKSL